MITNLSTGGVVTFEGFRASIDIDRAGYMQMGTMQAQIYGVSKSDINFVTTLRWKTGFILLVTIDVFAIDGSQETLVFSGDIVNAWGNFDNQPDVFVQIQAQTAYHAQLLPVSPRSYQGAIDVASVMGQIAQHMGYIFENNGVSFILPDLYLANTDLEQAKNLARMAGIDLYIDDKILAITPPNVARRSLIPEISKTSGLVGYPTFDGVGVNFKILFNPSVVFGGRVKLVSEVNFASGIWNVTNISHRLQSEMPGGVWFSTVRGIPGDVAITK